MVAFASQAFNDSLKESHKVITRVVLASGETILAVEVIGGSIKQNYDTTSRWSMDLEFMVPEAFTATDLQDLLLRQHLATLTAYRGIEFADGTQEYIKFARMYPTDIEYSETDSGAPTLRVSAFDQSVRCQGDVPSPFYIAANSRASDVVPQLLTRKQPSLKFSLASSQFLTPSLLITDGMDPWAEAQRLMSTNGQDLFMDRNDVCSSTTRAVSPTPDFVWHFDQNNRSDFLDLQRTAANDLFPNVINVVGNNPGAPGVAGQASDMEPSSPTYRYGPYGEQVRTFRSEIVTSSDQANQMARYLLSKLLGPQDQVAFRAIPNPTLDVGDTVAVTRNSMGLNQTRIIVSEVEMPLGLEADTMKVICRRSILTDPSGSPVRP